MKSKVIGLTELSELRQNNKHQKIVFTNGCFDLLHQGHLFLLTESKKMGQILVVGINTDDSIKKIKGAHRPIENLAKRIENLTQQSAVDFIIAFDTETPFELIQILQPDVLVKGGDYLAHQIVGADIVEENGGKVEIIPLLKGFSTTQILNDTNNYNSGK